MKGLPDIKLIRKAERTFPDFKVEYFLFERRINCNETVFDIKALKIPNEEMIYNVEEAILSSFESRKCKAIMIFEKTVNFDITPMCLEDSILEFI